MARTKKMSISEFMACPKQPTIKKKIDKKKVILTVAGFTVCIFLGAYDVALASTGIDAGAKVVYYKLVQIGKWIIIIKGAIDIIQSMAQGDFQAAKRHSLSYILIYVLLLGLPWGMDQVDQVFKEIK